MERRLNYKYGKYLHTYVFLLFKCYFENICKLYFFILDFSENCKIKKTRQYMVCVGLKILSVSDYLPTLPNYMLLKKNYVEGIKGNNLPKT